MQFNFNFKGSRNRPVWQPLIVIGGMWLLVASADAHTLPFKGPAVPHRSAPEVVAAVVVNPDDRLAPGCLPVPFIGRAFRPAAAASSMFRNADAPASFGPSSDLTTGVSTVTRKPPSESRGRDSSKLQTSPNPPGFLERLLQHYGPQMSPPSADTKTLFLLMGLIAAATLISEDMTCIGAGFLVARGTIAFIPATAACFLGIFIGDLLLFFAGRLLGKPALRLPPLKWLIKPEDIDGAARWFAAKGPVIIITSRFLPGSRLPTYFAAGMLGTRIWLFAGYFSVAALLWTPLLVGMATAVGGQMMIYFQMFQEYALLLLLGTLLLLWAAVKLLLPLFSYRGRRLLLSAWRRKTRWEFWSPYVFYVPVVLYVALLAIRHRSLTVFTAANPGIPESGFLFESKSDILDHLQADRHLIASYRLIRQSLPLESKWQAAREFMNTHRTGYPVVLKPDFGQRGSGVAIIRNEQSLKSYLAQSRRDVIIQEYAAGREFGLFYIRHPKQETGCIFSITDKRPLTVIGDGKRTLADLILADDQAVNMAPRHFKQHRHRLYDIPPAGHEVVLVEIGTHCRGALFGDGGHLKTPELETAVDRIAKGFEGFYFGRFDIRTTSVDDLKQGENFKVVELNGVTSEATHIYQRGTPLWRAYAVLMHQWRNAYAIGAANARNGCRKASVLKLARMLLRPPVPAVESPRP